VAIRSDDRAGLMRTSSSCVARVVECSTVTFSTDTSVYQRAVSLHIDVNRLPESWHVLRAISERPQPVDSVGSPQSRRHVTVQTTAGRGGRFYSSRLCHSSPIGTCPVQTVRAAAPATLPQSDRLLLLAVGIEK